MAGKRKVDNKELVNSFMDEPAYSSAGTVHFGLFNSAEALDMGVYLSILNNRERYIIHDRKTTWDKENGVTVGMTIAMEYTDRYPDS